MLSLPVLGGTYALLLSGLHPDGRVGVTEQELEEIVMAVQEDAEKATNEQAAEQAVGALSTEARLVCLTISSPLPLRGICNRQCLT